MHALQTADDFRPPSVRTGVEAFVERHQKALWRFLRTLGCDAAEADDLAQDAFVVALRRRIESHREDATAAAFLRQTARNLWLRRRRDDRRRNAKLAALAEEMWRRDSETDAGTGLLLALDRCLSTLPPRSRRVLDRFYRDGAGRAELAAELGMTEHGVRSLLQRVRKVLRDCIERRRG